MVGGRGAEDPGSLGVAVDGRSLRSPAPRGIANYTRFMLRSLAEAFPQDRYELVVPGRSPVAGEAELLHAGVRLHRPAVGGRPLHLTASLVGRPRLDRLAGRCDVAWAPAPAPLAISRGVPLVLAVHDLSWEHRPEDFSRYERAWHGLARPRALAARARRVVTNSEAVRGEVLAEWGLPPASVVTVHPGPGRPPATAAPAAGALGDAGEGSPAGGDVPDGFVLAVGALEPRKRPDHLVRAHALARSRGLRAGLVLAGDGPLRGGLARSGAVLLGHVPDAALDDLYRRALAVACVSSEEGFGFTPLEAVARGTPSVVSDLPCFRETLDAAVLRVPSDDVEALAAALLHLEREPGLRDGLVNSGRESLASLSWERAARALRAVLREAARDGSRAG